jgi:hypothetical protein
LRVYRVRGIAYASILGGLVNSSTATVAELSAALPAVGLVEATTVAVLLTSVAMFVGNLCSGSSEVCCGPTLGDVDLLPVGSLGEANQPQMPPT